MTTNDVSIYSTVTMPEGIERTLPRGACLTCRQIGRHVTTERPRTEFRDSRPSQNFGERVRQLEVSRYTYEFGEAALVVLADKHVAQV